jgi:outer membrane protein assembly factor BamA
MTRGEGGPWPDTLAARMRRAFRVLGLLSILAASRAQADGEIVTDVRVHDAVRTEEETVRSIAGISIGEQLQSDTLDIARERLHTSGLFANVNLYWEPYGEGVRVHIVVAEKFPWAPLPMFSYAPGNISAGGILAHGNLFGQGKRGLIGARISNVDSGVLVVYDDPAILGSRGFFTVKGKYQSQIIPEYSNTNISDMPLLPMRNTNLRSYGFEGSVGVAWYRRVRTSVGWAIDRNDVIWSTANPDNPYAVPPNPADSLPAGATSARR